jgi:tetratricopeptide (TPR) repeat protein
MRSELLAVLLLTASSARAADFELVGKVVPESSVSFVLHGATIPFIAATESDTRGEFRFHKLSAGTYILDVLVPHRGEVRQTVEIGPGLAESRGRVSVSIDLGKLRFETVGGAARATVSLHELAIPKEASREYEAADKRIARRDVTGAVAHLRRAVEISPNFSAAWNHLGTIAYQARQYVDAERDFQEALEANPEAFEPLVNLGGVLINLGRSNEALEYNIRAAIARPNDALAHSQLGMCYFYAGDLHLAETHLRLAKQIDPAHFSHPQILLAEIDVKRNRFRDAAGELEDLLQRHPDLPDAAKIRERIARLHSQEQ